MTVDGHEYEWRLEALLVPFADSEVDEVLVNADYGAWAVRRGESLALDSPFHSREELAQWLLALAERQQVRLDPVQGSAGGVLDVPRSPLVLRWHALLAPLSWDGPLLSLRRHRLTTLALDSFHADPRHLGKVTEAARQRRPILIVGPTASGKTTLMAALLRQVAAQERIVSVESLSELPRLNNLSVRLVGRSKNALGKGAIDVDRLLTEALRLRPDRLVVGEIRDWEAGALLSAMQTGHGGVMATMHAGSLMDARRRLRRLFGQWATRNGGESFGGAEMANGAEWDATIESLVVVRMERGTPPAIAEVSD